MTTQTTEIIELASVDFDRLLDLLDDPQPPNQALLELLAARPAVRGALCGPKFLRGITQRCDGSCCGLGADGMPDPVLVEKLNRRDEAWRRILRVCK